MRRAQGVPARTCVVAAALAVLLGSCGLISGDGPRLQPKPLASSTARVDSSSTDGQGLRPFYAQHVRWTGCRQTMKCTHILVPLDYSDPGGKAIGLSVLEVPATDADRRLGALVVNPGGPGVSGVDYAANAGVYFGPEVRSAFDIVGFDPRGVGSSTPIDCAGDAELDALVSADPDPDDAQ